MTIEMFVEALKEELKSFDQFGLDRNIGCDRDEVAAAIKVIENRLSFIKSCRSEEDI